MKIEVGEYVRLKGGLIGQFYNIEKGYDGNIEVNFEEFGYEYVDIEQFCEDIKSHSKNIIDLIEERRLCEWLSSKKNTEFLQCSVQF